MLLKLQTYPEKQLIKNINAVHFWPLTYTFDQSHLVAIRHNNKYLIMKMRMKIWEIVQMECVYIDFFEENSSLFPNMSKRKDDTLISRLTSSFSGSTQAGPVFGIMHLDHHLKLATSSTRVEENMSMLCTYLALCSDSCVCTFCAKAFSYSAPLKKKTTHQH